MHDDKANQRFATTIYLAAAFKLAAQDAGGCFKKAVKEETSAKKQRKFL